MVDCGKVDEGSNGGLSGHLVQDFAHDRKVMDPVTEESQQVQK